MRRRVEIPTRVCKRCGSECRLLARTLSVSVVCCCTASGCWGWVEKWWWLPSRMQVIFACTTDWARNCIHGGLRLSCTCSRWYHTNGGGGERGSGGGASWRRRGIGDLKRTLGNE
ncbi:hypothetical protein BDZ91DRAFT_370110 [Kalaharituber pfeilii]|nr:hypothetical protein BDZ91DRAFT_370110 [Kalaharituber pfeilii]